MTVIQSAVQGYHYIFNELPDPRTKDWWLVSGPGPLVTILVSYLYFCLKAGPKFMENRKPYDLKTVIMLYNVFQIILSIYFTFMGMWFIITEKYENGCFSVDTSESPSALRWAAAVWWYYFAKITELLDTIFFVLRKKERQITFLHLYHHTFMPILGFIGINYVPGGQAVAEGSINGFIHVVMYTYYLISGLGPQYQKYLWWKKYLTSMQLIQFCIVAFLNIKSYSSVDCSYPKSLSIFVLLNTTAFFYMFGRFYYHNYVASQKKQNINGTMTGKNKLKYEKNCGKME